MDVPRTQSRTRIALYIAAAVLIAGLILFAKGFIWGVALVIIGLSIGIVAMTMLKFMSWYDYPWLLNKPGGKNRVRGLRGGCPPQCDQYLLLSAGWCFLKQSLQ